MATINELLRDAELDRRKEEREHRATLEAQLASLNEKLERLVAPPPLRRSQMTAREKSDYITAHGRANYEKLAW